MNNHHEHGRNDINTKLKIDDRMFLRNVTIQQVLMFDKAILTLSASAFGISIVFLDKLAADPVKALLALIFAWVWFGICITLTFSAYLVSQKNNELHIDDLDKKLKSGVNGIVGSPKKLGRVVERLNILSVVTFILGIIFLAYFSIANIT